MKYSRHKRDWKRYNKQLKDRDNLNFGVTKKSLKFCKEKTKDVFASFNLVFCGVVRNWAVHVEIFWCELLIGQTYRVD